MPHSPASPENEHGFALSERCSALESIEGSAETLGQRSGGGCGEALRHQGGLRRGDDDLFSKATETDAGDHPVAHSERLDIVGDLGDPSGNLRARGEGRNRLDLVSALDKECVNVVEASRLNLQPDAPGSQRWRFNLLNDKICDLSNLGTADNSHRLSLSPRCDEAQK